jgi:hypothetical protein
MGLRKCQTPQAIPPSNKTRKTPRAKTTNLNFRYRFLSGGASELCGKYGGGVYVAINAPSNHLKLIVTLDLD